MRVNISHVSRRMMESKPDPAPIEAENVKPASIDMPRRRVEVKAKG